MLFLVTFVCLGLQGAVTLGPYKHGALHIRVKRPQVHLCIFGLLRGSHGWLPVNGCLGKRMLHTSCTRAGQSFNPSPTRTSTSIKVTDAAAQALVASWEKRRFTLTPVRYVNLDVYVGSPRVFNLCRFDVFVCVCVVC